MTIDEIKLTICEYMGWYCTYFAISNTYVWVNKDHKEVYRRSDTFLPPEIDYLNSLDKLKPVWEKLGVSQFKGFTKCLPMRFTIVIEDYQKTFHGEQETMEESAAHATALAILDLEKKDDKTD